MLALQPLVVVAQSQDMINFQDLARPGQAVNKQYTVPGLADDGRRYLLKFDGVDTARVEAMRAAMAAAPSGNDSSGRAANSGGQAQASNRQGAGNKTEQSGPKRFACTIYCKSGSGPTITRHFQAKTRHEAAVAAGDAADQLCRDAMGSMASSRALPDRQCSEQ